MWKSLFELEQKIRVRWILRWIWCLCIDLLYFVVTSTKSCSALVVDVCLLRLFCFCQCCLFTALISWSKKSLLKLLPRFRKERIVLPKNVKLLPHLLINSLPHLQGLTTITSVLKMLTWARLLKQQQSNTDETSTLSPRSPVFKSESHYCCRARKLAVI